MRFFILLFVCCVSTAAFAQMPGLSGNNTAGNKKAPVEIEASQQLEWLRDKNMYRATGDVHIKQGDTVITGDNATAAYDPATGPSALTEITVSGHVVMTNLDRTIHSDKAVYDTRSQLLKLTGSVVTLNTPTMNAIAHDGMEYNAAENKAVASGNAEVSDATQKVKAARITAWLDKDNKLQRAEAAGNVVITHKAVGGSGTDIAQSDHALYDAVKNTADLNGNVKLTRGENHMQGDHAVIDLASGTSTLKNDAGGTGRVRAIFTPGDDKAPLPNVTAAMPMVHSKEKFESAYAVGVTEPDQPIVKTSDINSLGVVKP